MNEGTPPPRSIAAELALLFLRELESRVPDDPELLVSTEAVLSFAAIRHADPLQWEHWRAILEKYEKSDLIEYMLRQTARIEVRLEELAPARRTFGSGLELLRSMRKGTVDYSAVPELKGVDLERYRKTPVEVIKVSFRD